jgi:glycosyltransferase involved in cell wall biosynthesis
VPYSTPLHPKILELKDVGIELRPRLTPSKPWARLVTRFRGSQSQWETLIRQVAVDKTDLVAICDGGTWLPCELMAALSKWGVPFVTLAQANHDWNWPDDDYRCRLEPLMANAACVFFVSHANLELAEYQLGCKLSNAEVVSNPWTVDRHAPPPWPATDPMNELKLACVARLHPPSKGQDLLLLALAAEKWRHRHWGLTFFGEGPQRGALELMAARLGLNAKVSFAGNVSQIVEVWAQYHALVLPSRFEGMPLALLEALVCGRPAVVTAVAGNSQVVVEGRSGFVAQAPTVASVQEALERLWENRAKLRDMGLVARDELLSRHQAEPAQLFADELLDLAKRRQKCQTS